MDGNYGGTMQLHVAHADAAIFLDLPTLSCAASVLRRRLRWRGEVRPDLPEGCREKAGVLERLARFDGEVVVLCSRREVRSYLRAC